MLSTKQPLRLSDLQKHYQVWPVVQQDLSSLEATTIAKATYS